jgi:hypothetical protein
MYSVPLQGYNTKTKWKKWPSENVLPSIFRAQFGNEGLFVLATVALVPYAGTLA